LPAIGAAALTVPGRALSQTRQNNKERTDVRITLSFGNHTMTATLFDNPSARDFASMLPLDLKIEDFSSNEKIAHLPRKLTVEGHGPFDKSGHTTSVTTCHGAISRCSSPTTSIPV